MEQEPLSADYWNELYLTQQTAWDIGYVSTPIKTYIDQLTDKNISILIPGAGKGHEAEYLAQQGFQRITVIDLSSVAADSLRETIGVNYPSINIITGDFFSLEGSFDLILEQTFFCALDPSLRKNYVQQMSKLLSGNGTLAGVLFNRDFESSPPYGGSIDEYRQLFGAALRIKTLEPCYNSIPHRAGAEAFVVAKKDA